jgi:hypothetical protein
VTTFKKIGIYWKCVVSMSEPGTMCFRLKTLPNNRYEQNLYCPYTDKDGDKKQLATKMVGMIVISSIGKASWDEPPLQRTDTFSKDELIQPQYYRPDAYQSFAMKQPVQPNETIETVMINTSLQMLSNPVSLRSVTQPTERV